MESEPLLCQAEILYLSLRELIHSEDRRQAYLQAVRRSDSSTGDSGKDAAAAQPSVVDDSIRELLN